MIWQCNDKYKKKDSCTAPHLLEEEIQRVFMRAWEIILENKNRFLQEYKQEVVLLEDAAHFDRRIALLKEQCNAAVTRVQDCIAGNASSAQNQADYKKRYETLTAEYEAAREAWEAVIKEKQACAVKKEKLRRFIRTLEKAANAPVGFGERLWRETVETVIIYGTDNIAVRFHSGTEIRVDVK